MNKKLLCAFLLIAGSSFFIVMSGKKDPREITATDKTEITSVAVHSIARPHSIEHLRKSIIESDQPIALAGSRYSQGGQTAYPGGTVIDMSFLNEIISLDLNNKRLSVQAGATWRRIQEYIDRYNLSLKVMQSYNDFSVGGSLSVNCHARDMNYSSLISTVESIKIMLSDGSLVTANRKQNKELFTAAIGGYGLLGVIVEATLSLTDNIRLERQVKALPSYAYPYLLRQIKHDPTVVFQNADIFPMDFNRALSITWRKTTKPLTTTDRLQDSTASYLPQKALETLARKVSLFKKARPALESLKGLKKEVVWRNYEMSYTVNQLAIQSHYPTTATLQEYFVPVKKYHQALTILRTELNRYGVNVLNLSIRYVHKDTETLLSYAPKDSYAFVLYMCIPNSKRGKEYLGMWTKKITEEILKLGGTYYLPYVACATKKQFQRAYPGYKKLRRLKKKYDPQCTFRNMLWKKYFE